jgi:hypothetical protein
MAAAAEFLVDFVIGGTQKGGTSALAHFLGGHPEICLPKVKEVHLFDAPDFPVPACPAEISRRYKAAFEVEQTAGRIVGDATPVYMYLPWVVPRIRAYNPAMKWILLLRDPVERAISHYRMERGRGGERLPLSAALACEGVRLWRDHGRMGWDSSLRVHSYVDRGFYSQQISHLWRFFPREQILVLTSEQLRDRHHETLQLVYTFLGVRDCTVVPPPQTVFATPGEYSVSWAARAWLRLRFQPEIRRLERMLNRKLPQWRAAQDEVVAAVYDRR